MPEIKAEDFVRLATLYIPETANALAFSPDGKLLAVAAGDKVHVFRVPAPNPPTPNQSGATVGQQNSSL